MNLFIYITKHRILNVTYSYSKRPPHFLESYLGTASKTEMDLPNIINHRLAADLVSRSIE